MPGLKVVRPREVDAYECDGPTCRETCEAYRGDECGWVAFAIRVAPYGDVMREWKWFHSWECLAEWACYQHQIRPMRVHQAPERLPRPPF